MDVEFVAQYLTPRLRPREAGNPRRLDPPGDRQGRAAPGFIDARHVETLIEAHRLYTDATQFMRLAIAGPFDPKTAASGVKRRIAASTGFPDFEAFVDALDEARRKVREAYEAVVKGLRLRGHKGHEVAFVNFFLW